MLYPLSYGRNELINLECNRPLRSASASAWPKRLLSLTPVTPSPPRADTSRSATSSRGPAFPAHDGSASPLKPATPCLVPAGHCALQCVSGLIVTSKLPWLSPSVKRSKPRKSLPSRGTLIGGGGWG